jgi:hypothetical protein
MSEAVPISPRQAALEAVLRARDKRQDPRISEAVWSRLLELAWDERSLVGDRREHRRSIGETLMKSSPPEASR